MPTQIVTRTVNAGGVSYSQTSTITAPQEIVTQESVADAATDFQITLPIDISAVKSLLISSTETVTIETNSGSAPDDTLTVNAGDPYLWTTSDPASLLLSEDIAAIFVTNASGTAATVTVVALLDSSP